VGIGDLWPEIDSSHNADCKGSFATTMLSHLEPLMLCPLLGAKGKQKEGMREATEGAFLGQALRQSSAPLKGCGGGLAKSKATQILTDASGDILPCMKLSFAKS
jgi:hypothetical protein